MAVRGREIPSYPGYVLNRSENIPLQWTSSWAE